MREAEAICVHQVYLFLKRMPRYESFRHDLVNLARVRVWKALDKIKEPEQAATFLTVCVRRELPREAYMLSRVVGPRYTAIARNSRPVWHNTGKGVPEHTYEMDTSSEIMEELLHCCYVEIEREIVRGLAEGEKIGELARRLGKPLRFIQRRRNLVMSRYRVRND